MAISDSRAGGPERSAHHPHLVRGGEFYTPRDERFLGLLDELRLEHGSWKNVVRQARISTRAFRRIRLDGRTQAVSQTVVDKILSRTGFVHRMVDLEWYTPDELVEKGIWKPHNTDGLVRWDEQGRKVRK